MHIISAADFPLFFSNSARKRLILPAERSPQKSVILLEILPEEFIQAYLFLKTLSAKQGSISTEGVDSILEILAVKNLERFKCTFKMFCNWITGITTVSFRKLVSVVWSDHCESETSTPNESDELLINIHIKISVKIPRQKVQKVFSSLVPSLQQ